jgi:hypothetical protein
MKYSTYVAFGIKPSVLKQMLLEDALKAQKEGAIQRKIHLTHNSPPQHKWCKKRKMLVDYIEKSIVYFDKKLEELK